MHCFHNSRGSERTLDMLLTYDDFLCMVAKNGIEAHEDELPVIHGRMCSIIEDTVQSTEVDRDANERRISDRETLVRMGHIYSCFQLGFLPKSDENLAVKRKWKGFKFRDISLQMKGENNLRCVCEVCQCVRFEPKVSFGYGVVWTDVSLAVHADSESDSDDLDPEFPPRVLATELHPDFVPLLIGGGRGKKKKGKKNGKRRKNNDMIGAITPNNSAGFGNVPRQFGGILPRVRVWHRYQQTQSSGAILTLAFAQTIYRMNSTFAPLRTGVNPGHQPLYRDTYAALYAYYFVVGFKWKVTFPCLADRMEYIVTPSNGTQVPPTTIDTFDNCREDPWSKCGLTGFQGSPSCVLRGKVSLPKINGRPTDVYATTPNVYAAFGANPVEVLDFNINFYNTGVVTSTSVYMLELEYDTIWYDPILPGVN